MIVTRPDRFAIRRDRLFSMLDRSDSPFVISARPPSPPRQHPIDLPADRLLDRVAALPGASLLQGSSGFGEAGRWSLYGLAARGRFLARGRSWRLHCPTETRHGRGDPLAALGAWIDRLRLGAPIPDVPDAPPLIGGLIGFYGYDLAPRIERLPRRQPRDCAIPDVAFTLHDAVCAIDHENQAASLWLTDLFGDSEAVADRRALRILRKLHEPIPNVPRTTLEQPLVPGLSPEAYRLAVRRTIDYIEAGDIFQANISHRFDAIGRPEAHDLFGRLHRRSPAPFAALVRWGQPGLAVVSSSPELFFEVRGGRIVTRPIKGTRPRGANSAEDRLQRDELIASPKDRAELTMIVDLERNDLGRVCAFGSVRVVEPRVIESYATVHHQVATVEGRLRPEVGPIEVVRALFPGGSITGAPKIRAMEIIDELEPNRRNLYTGAIGYYGLGGSSAFNIAIRTLLIDQARVSYQVGGGIVADSDPQLEYEETLHKGRALRDVLEARA